MNSRATRLTIGVLGIAFGVATEIASFDGATSPEAALIHLLVGLAFLLGGLFAWGREPENRTWPVMAAAGIGWFVGNLAAVSMPLLHAAGIVFADSDAILLVVLVLIYPTGRFDDRVGRWFAGLTAVVLTASNVVALLTGSTAAPLVTGLAVTAGIGILVPRRWIRATPARRRTLGPAMFATSATIFGIGVAIVARLVEFDVTVRALLLAIRDVAVLAIPLGFVGGFLEQTAEELRRSRIRIVEAGDQERRRIERDLHDGAQQRLVTAAMSLQLARAKLRPDADGDAVGDLNDVQSELKAGLADLRELARGIHPAVLTDLGLNGAFAALADRSAVPTTVEASPTSRFDPLVEATAYFVASEALANVAKHAGATRAWIRSVASGRELRVVIGDDGLGGADPERGTGLQGLRDRVLAVGGRLEVESPVGRGTTLTAVLPLAQQGTPPIVDEPHGQTVTVDVPVEA